MNNVKHLGQNKADGKYSINVSYYYYFLILNY